MPASKAEQVLEALRAALETVPDAVVQCNSVLPEKVPAAGLSLSVALPHAGTPCI